MTDWSSLAFLLSNNTKMSHIGGRLQRPEKTGEKYFLNTKRTFCPHGLLQQKQILLRKTNFAEEAREGETSCLYLIKYFFSGLFWSLMKNAGSAIYGLRRSPKHFILTLLPWSFARQVVSFPMSTTNFSVFYGQWPVGICCSSLHLVVCCSPCCSIIDCHVIYYQWSVV